MRSLLFAPGGSPKMMAKAAAGEADAVIFDLEDAVQPDRKEEARRLVIEALTVTPRSGPLIYVRVNPLDSPWCPGDLDAVLPLRPHGIMLPKLSGPHDLDRLDALIGEREPRDAIGSTRILPVCTETAASTLSLAADSWPVIAPLPVRRPAKSPGRRWAAPDTPRPPAPPCVRPLRSWA